MTAPTIITSELDRLSDIAINLSGDLVQLFLKAQRSDIAGVPNEDERDQAIEAFMDERTELQDKIDRREEHIDGLYEKLEALGTQAAAADHVFLTIGEFATNLQTSLNSIGISYVADPVTGLANITVDRAQLEGFLEVSQYVPL